MKHMNILKLSAVFAVLSLSALSTSQVALASPEIAKKNNCLACHTLDKRVIGPSIRDMAKKYKGDPGAVSRLVDRVRRGSVGVWGQTPMQAYPDLSQQDAEAVVRWMLDR